MKSPRWSTFFSTTSREDGGVEGVGEEEKLQEVTCHGLLNPYTYLRSLNFTEEIKQKQQKNNNYNE